MMHVSVQSGEAARNESRLGAAFLVALMLHVGGLVALTLWSSRNVQSPPGEQEITIDLAPAMEFAEALSPAEASSPAEVLAEAAEVPPPIPVTDEAPPPEEVAETVEATETPPQEISEVVPPAEPVEAVPADAVPIEADAAPAAEVVAALPPPEEVVEAKTLDEKPAPKPLKREPPKRAERKPPPPRRAVAERRSAPSTPRQGQASSSRENTGGAAASADPNVLNRYVAQLASVLRNRLRYPESARAQRISGVATVRFTMQRSGQIVSASLVRSTGHAILDHAALATAAPGTRLPAAPEAMPQQQFTFSVPLRFNLR